MLLSNSTTRQYCCSYSRARSMVMKAACWPKVTQTRRVCTAAMAFDTCTLVAVASNMDGGMYEIGQFMNNVVQESLTELSPATCGAVLLAGLLTSVSPCTLSVLPLTIGYIAGYADSSDSGAPESSPSTTTGPNQQTAGPDQQQTAAADSAASSSSSSSSDDSSSSSSQQNSTSSSSSSSRLTSQAVCFSLGLASSLAGLGLISSSVGRAYGQIGSGLPTAVALVAILMGLNLLEVVVVPLPSLPDVDVRRAGLPAPLMAYLAGATFALAASPCSTPVLASLLAFASTQQSPFAAAALLFLYSCGYVAPLLLAATATGAAKQLLDMRQYSRWVTPVSGVLLVSGGTYAMLSRLLPAA